MSESQRIAEAVIEAETKAWKRWFQDGAAKSGSKSKARKAASAAIAKIPFVLAQHIARVYKPKGCVK